MKWLKKEQSQREKHGKTSVETVVIKLKVSWEVAELPQLGVVVKFFPSAKPKWVYNNVLIHGDREVEIITRSIRLRWNV
jgi:hypothetical protein